MTTAATNIDHTANSGWFRKSEAWLDARGKGAWIAAMVLGFVFFWPIGLALLFYMIWSKQMFSKNCSSHSRRSHRAHRHHGQRAHFHSSGNSAFDAYRADTIRRLENEQHSFESFLQRLRDAKDKAEFDDFMDERVEAAASAREEGAEAEPNIDADENAPVTTKEPRK